MMERGMEAGRGGSSSSHVCDETQREKTEKLQHCHSQRGERRGEERRGEGVEKEQRRVTQRMGRVEEEEEWVRGEDEGFSSTISGTQVRGSKQARCL